MGNLGSDVVINTNSDRDMLQITRVIDSIGTKCDRNHNLHLIFSKIKSACNISIAQLVENNLPTYDVIHIIVYKISE